MPDSAAEPSASTRGVHGRVVLIAGASSDSGRAVATALEGAGAVVLAVGSSLERLQRVPASSRYACDLADPVAVEALVARVRAEHGRLDGVIHLVGGWRAGRDDADFDWLERRVLTTVRVVSRAVADDLARVDAGRFAIVGSTAAESPTWGNAGYATLKAAAMTWVEALASGWRKGGTAAAVSFVVRALGPDHTPVERLADAVVGLWDAPAAEFNGRRIPLR